MAIPRLQLFELEDLPWFPRAIRDPATNHLQFMEKRLALHEPIVPLVRDALERSKARRVVDLCSGAAGCVASVHEALAGDGISLPLTLTDKYPNLLAFRCCSALHPSGVFYVEDSVDATAVPQDFKGMRTMFNAFHHFAPESARRALRCAVEAQQPIAIFEIPERSWATIFPLLFTPIFVALATPFIRPFQWRLLWTYLIPLVPVTSWWDGVVSQLRAYTCREILELAQEFGDYEWRAGRVAIRGKLGHLTYPLGNPKPEAA